MLNKALIILSGALITGCSSLGIGSEEYSCSGLPKGVQCKSAKEVYLNRHSLPTEPLQKPRLSTKLKAPVSPAANPIAIKSKPADVAIIVLKSYTDSQGALHQQPYIYMSLANSSWNLDSRSYVLLPNQKHELLPYKENELELKKINN